MCKICGGINNSPWGVRVRRTAKPKERDNMKPVRPWDLLNKDNWTMEEVREKRLEICNACPDLLITRQCKHCMCFMDIKTKLENAYCPLRKW